eukprot:9504147-Pyramimonas_sp.AAC.2
MSTRHSRRLIPPVEQASRTSPFPNLARPTPPIQSQGSRQGLGAGFWNHWAYNYVFAASADKPSPGVLRGRPAAKPSGKLLKGPSQKSAPNGLPRRGDHDVLGPMYVTYGSKASYITYKDSGSGKPKLLIQIGESMSSDHASVCAKILKFATENSSSKEECVEYRSTLLKRGSKG